MRSFIAFLLLIVLCVPCLSYAENIVTLPEFSSIGDVLDEKEPDAVYCSDDYYAVAIDFSGIYIRYAADLPAGSDINPDNCNTYYDLIRNLPISYAEVFTVLPIFQEDLDLLWGMSYKDLLKIGFEYVSSGEMIEANRIVFRMAYGVFDYDFIMDADTATYNKCTEKGSYDDLTVKCATYNGLSYHAADLSYLVSYSFSE